MSDREKFEEFAKREGWSVERWTGASSELYRQKETRLAWKGFQAALSSRDSTPTEGAVQRVTDEWWSELKGAVSKSQVADLAQRINRALTAPRVTLDLRNATVLNVDGKPMISVWELDRCIRAQLPNVEVVTES